MTIFDPEFWTYAGERAVKTAAQSVLGVFTADLLTGGIEDWRTAGLVVLVAVVGSVLTSVVNAPSKYEDPML